MKGIFPILVSILSLILIFNLSSELVRLSKAGQRLKQAQEKVDKLKFDNWQLRKELEYRQTNEFLEGQIRDKLGLTKEGEAVVVLPRQTLEKIASQAAVGQEEKPLPVWQQWLEIFW